MKAVVVICMSSSSKKLLIRFCLSSVTYSCPWAATHWRCIMLLFVGCKSEQENVSYWRTLALVFYLFILTWAEVVLSCGGKGEEMRGMGPKGASDPGHCFNCCFYSYTYYTLVFPVLWAVLPFSVMLKRSPMATWCFRWLHCNWWSCLKDTT